MEKMLKGLYNFTRQIIDRTEVISLIFIFLYYYSVLDVVSQVYECRDKYNPFVLLVGLIGNHV